MLADLVVCPACAGDLAGGAAPGDLRCRSCDRSFPARGGLACLLLEPQRWLDLWRAQLAVIHEEADGTVDGFETELRKPGLLLTTRTRLEEQLRLTRRLVDEIDEALLPVVGEPPSLDDRDDLDELTRGYQPLESLHLLHRDWGWPGGDENGRALACVERVVGAPLGRMVVIGAGACRLAYDLHVKRGAATTLALDIDPLAFSVAGRLLRGERVTLTEMRSNATEMSRLCAVRTLEAPHGPAERFHLLLANGLEPPLRKHSFDTVLTPWFIDLVPPDLRDFIGVVRGLLAPGGRWINYGPLLYPLGRPAACRFSREELLDLINLAGFEIEATTSELMPYSLSPLTDRGRLEPCLAFSARAHDGAPSATGDPPAWIVIPSLPVPDFAGRSLFHHDKAAYRAIIELVDGRRSIDDIARALTALTGANPPGLKDTIRLCLIETHPLARGHEREIPRIHGAARL